MKFISLLVVGIVSLVNPSFAAESKLKCQFETAPEHIEWTKEGGQIVIWTEPDKETLWNVEFQHTKEHHRYLSWINEHTKLSSLEILENHRDIVEKTFLYRAHARDVMTEQNPDVHNSNLIIEGRVGKIRPINCLETWLFDTFNHDYPLSKSPKEFHAAILRNEKSKQIRIYYEHQADGIDYAGVNTSDKVLGLIKRDLAEGWTLFYDLHNHPFNFKNPYGDLGGILCPSTADMSFYHYPSPGLENAVITNGRDTIEMTASHLKDLRDE